jgi:predicted amidohydrolase
MKHIESFSSASIPEPRLSRRDFLVASAAAAGGALVPSVLHAASPRPDTNALAAAAIEPWAPHPKAAPRTVRHPDAFAIDANGTRTCTGGWQWRYDGIVAGQAYELIMEAGHAEIAVPREALNCTAIWGAPKPAQSNPGAIWEYLLPASMGAGRLRFSRRIVAPAAVKQLTLRATLRWTASGKTHWQVPRVVAIDAPPRREPIRISVITGTNAERRNRQFKSAAENVEFYGQLCAAACQRDRPQLLVLPEVALQWGLRGNALDLAVPAPGPETDAFGAIARRHRVRIAVGMYELDGDAVFNSLVLLGPSGLIEGRYRKVHLAHGEDLSGVLPGDAFPVFATELGRIGCNICMDSMAPESARMVALNGADFLLLPIMGDFRADRWDMGPPIFHEERWRTIMGAQALDNQLTMVIARNRSIGSCIINRKGEFLAWNNGDEPFITADVPREDGYRSWNGSCFRDSAWQVRRPHLYDAFTDLTKLGSST